MELLRTTINVDIVINLRTILKAQKIITQFACACTEPSQEALIYAKVNPLMYEVDRIRMN